VSIVDDYRGISFSGVDGKDRFTLPADLRHRVRAGSNGNILHLHLADDCPYMLGFGSDYLNEKKEEISDDMRAARALGNAFDRHALGRIHGADVEDVTFDDGGRFGLPEDIRQIMGITDCLFFVGAIWSFEIWAPQRFLEAGQGSELSRMRCRRFLEQWEQNPKNPNRKGAQ
jgi:DNA-binding transcriptional regulator/RsmH inhibitor MraZ